MMDKHADRPERRIRLLIAARALRSIAQGALVVDFALYLRALGWTGAHIGGVMAAGLLLGVALTLLLGPLSDRVGRKPFLLVYEALQIAAAAVALVTSAPAWLAAAAVAGSFGRGGNGATGPFSPIEQAWLAAGLAPARIVRVFRLNAAVGFFGMGAGAVLAMLPSWLATTLPGPLAFRPIFGFAAVASAACLGLLAAIDEPPRPASRTTTPPERRRTETRNLIGLMSANALNGLGIGMVGPFIAYWFHIRFGVGPARIGPVMALGFVLAGLSTLGTQRLIGRLGLVDAIVVMRILGLLFLAMLPFAPSYGVAAALHVLRGMVNRGTAGARQALTMQLVELDRRGLAASLSAVSTQITRALGPLLGGWLFDIDLLAVPFLVAGAFQTAYLVLYRRLFRGHPAARPEQA
ncbi:MAG TPA: MFS transporter [Candidatus Sulfotelmatobacter sp.]|nr:MFS transporter [Candidatus Sulfotelmatobacter sp.]